MVVPLRPDGKDRANLRRAGRKVSRWKLYMQRPWGMSMPDLFEGEKGRQEIRRSEYGMQRILRGREYGFYSKYNRKLFERFKQESDMI